MHADVQVKLKNLTINRKAIVWLIKDVNYRDTLIEQSANTAIG